MIKDSVKSVASNIFKGVKSGTKKAGSFLLDEFVGEVENRSPTLGSMLKNKIEDIRTKNLSAAQNYDQFVEKDQESVDAFKGEVLKNNPKLSEEAVEKKTKEIIKNIEASFQKNPEEAKKSELYKQYEPHFEKYNTAIGRDGDFSAKSVSKEQMTASKAGREKPAKSTSKSNQEPQSKVSAQSQESPQVLEDIATNTKETVEALKNKTEEPKTISSAISGKGADLISKVFSEKTIDKYAEKIRESLGLPKESEESETPKDKDLVLEELKKINKFLEAREKDDSSDEIAEQENKIEVKKSELDEIQEKTKDKLQQDENKTIERSKSVKDRLEEKTLDKSNPLKRDPGESSDLPDDRTRRERKRSNRQNKKLRNLNPAGDKLVQAGKDKKYIPTTQTPNKITGGRFTEPAYKAGQLAGRTGRSIASGPKTAMNAVSGIGRAASIASSVPGMAAGGSAMGTLGTAALWGGGALLAGAAGYGIGTLAAKGIDSGISALTGKETSLGGWIYDQFNDDPNSPEAIAKYNASPEGLKKAAESKARIEAAKQKRIEAAKTAESPAVTAVQPVEAKAAAPNPIIESVAPVKTSRVDVVEAALNKQDIIASEKEEKMGQPIIVSTGGNTTNNTSSGGGGGGAIVASPVRNTESTYERVQMQDFWPRAK